MNVDPFWTCRYCNNPSQYFDSLGDLHIHIVEKHPEVMNGEDWDH